MTSGNTPAPSPANRWFLLPAVLGVCAALALGGAGFSLGCLYAEATHPESRPEPVAVVATARLARESTAPAVAPAGITEAMGGPEDATPAAAATEVRVAQRPGEPLPMAMPVVGGWVSSHYGQRLDPFTGRPAIHRGLDFAGLDNSAILAAAAGVVTWSGHQGGYGNFIEIDHGNGWVTRYGHNAFNLVQPGDYVKPGQTIALMGSTGRATGTHLHFEVLYRGRQQNPGRFMPPSA